MKIAPSFSTLSSLALLAFDAFRGRLDRGEEVELPPSPTVEPPTPENEPVLGADVSNAFAEGPTTWVAAIGDSASEILLVSNGFPTRVYRREAKRPPRGVSDRSVEAANVALMLAEGTLPLGFVSIELSASRFFGSPNAASTMNLRNRAIRLAAARPELREALLPLLVEKTASVPELREPHGSDWNYFGDSGGHFGDRSNGLFAFGEAKFSRLPLSAEAPEGADLSKDAEWTLTVDGGGFFILVSWPGTEPIVLQKKARLANQAAGREAAASYLSALASGNFPPRISPVHRLKLTPSRFFGFPPLGARIEMKNLRASLIRLAFENPSLRKDLLPLLSETPKRASEDGELRPFESSDWNSFNGAAKFPNGDEPLIAYGSVNSMDLKYGKYDYPDALDFPGGKADWCLIADAEGLSATVTWGPAETQFILQKKYPSAKKALADSKVVNVLKQLRSGRVPPRMDQI